MLRATVSLSQKVRRGRDSTVCGLTLSGEVLAVPDDAEAVLERISELFDLAREVLAQEIQRNQSGVEHRSGTIANGHPCRERDAPPSEKGNPRKATAKQLRYLGNLARRHGLSSDGLAATIAEVLGPEVTLDRLSKWQAGQLITRLVEVVEEPSSNGK